MHEYPFTKSIIDIAERIAREKKAKKVTAIKLVVGELSGYIGDSIEFYFDIISKGTMAENAKLDIKIIKAKLYCPYCKKYFDRAPLASECPECKKEVVITDIGKECYIESVELEFED